MQHYFSNCYYALDCGAYSTVEQLVLLGSTAINCFELSKDLNDVKNVFLSKSSPH